MLGIPLVSTLGVWLTPLPSPILLYGQSFLIRFHNPVPQTRAGLSPACPGVFSPVLQGNVIAWLDFVILGVSSTEIFHLGPVCFSPSRKHSEAGRVPDLCLLEHLLPIRSALTLSCCGCRWNSVPLLGGGSGTGPRLCVFRCWCE